MSRFLQQTIVIVALGFGLQAAARDANGTPTVVPPQAATTPTADSSAPIDPQARALLGQMAAAYRALVTYSGTMTFSGTGLPNAPHVHARIGLYKPDRIAVVTEDATGTTRAVVDGAFLYVHKPHVPGAYLKLPVTPGEQAVQRALGHAGAAGLSPTPYLFAGADLSARLGSVLSTLSVGAPGVVDNVAVETVVATLGNKTEPRIITFAIGKKDHLLRQATMTMTIDGAPATLVETHTDIKANPSLPARTFVWVPPPDAQALATLDAWIAAVGAAVPAPPLTTSGLVVLPGRNDKSGRHDFGRVTLLDRPKIEHTFTLKNTGEQPLTITRLQSSCGCASALVQPQHQSPSVNAPSKAGLAILAPGEEGSVRVVVDLAGLPPGPIHKPVSVFVQDSAQPAAQLMLHGTLLPSVTFAPAPVDFGRLLSGTAHSLTLTATLDARLAISGMPSLISSNPAVRVAASTAEAARPSDASSENAATRVQTYTLTLAPDAPIGPIIGSLQLVPFGLVPPEPAVVAALRTASAIVVGQVVGDVSAEPAMLALGVASAGQTTTRQVVLKATRAAALQSMNVWSDDPWLTARLGAPGAGPAASTRTLEVTLGQEAPAGAVQFRLHVTLGNGQRLSIPVSGYVQPPEAKP